MTDLPEPSLDHVPARDWIETHAEPFVVIDAKYTIVAANAAYARAYGADPAELIGRKCHAVSHRSEVPCHENGENCPHARVFATGQPTQVDHVHFDVVGQADRVRLSARPLRLADGSLVMTESVRRLEAEDHTSASEMIGTSAAYNDMMAQLIDAAASDLPAVLTGETGVGKELAASFIHERSSQRTGRLVVIDCTAIPETLFEAELFGHERARSPARRRAASGSSRRPSTAHSFSTNSVNCRWRCRPSCCVSSSTASSVGSGPTRSGMCRAASSPRPTRR